MPTKLKKFNSLDLLVQICTYSISLIPLALILGPAVVEILLFISTCTFIVYILLKKEYYYFNNRFVQIFIIFWIYLVVNSFFSNNFFISFKPSFFYIRFLFFSLSIWFVLEKNSNFIKLFLSILTFCFLALTLDTIFTYFNEGVNIFGWRSPEKLNRISSFFNQEMIMGSYSVRLLPILFLGFYHFQKRFLILSLGIGSMIVIFLSGERTAYAMILVFIAIFFFYIKNFYLQKYLISIFTIFIVILVLSTNTPMYDRIVKITLEEFKGEYGNSGLKELNFNENEDKVNPIKIFNYDFYFISPQHQALYKSALNVYKKNKLIGQGLKGFRTECGKYAVLDGLYNVRGSHNIVKCSTHPHNIFLQFLSETGIIGTLFYFLAIAFVIKKLKELYNVTLKYRIYELLILSTFILNLLPFIPSGSFFNNWLSTIFYIPVGIYLFYLKKKKIKKFI